LGNSTIHQDAAIIICEFVNKHNYIITDADLAFIIESKKYARNLPVKNVPLN
jgi:hypothetical protein